MKFIVRWQVPHHNRHEVFKSFGAMSDEDIAKDMSGVKLVGRWHDLSRGTGALIAETNDPAALTDFLLHWNGAIDILETTPVLDDKIRTGGLGSDHRIMLI